MSNAAIPEDADHPNVLHGLARKRAEIAGKMEEHRREARRLLDELGHIDAAIRIFDPRVDIGRIRAKPTPPPHRAGNGQVINVMFDALGEAAKPLTTADVARRVMEDRGLDTSDAELMSLMVNRVRASLGAQRAKGLIRSLPHPSGLLGWELVG